MAMLIGMMLTVAGVALLGRVIKESIWPQTNSMKGARNYRDQIIEIDDYEIVDEMQNKSSDGYKVEIHD